MTVQRSGATVELKIKSTDRNGKMARFIAPVANWAGSTGNGLTRPLLESVAGLDRRAELPKYVVSTLEARASAEPLAPNKEAPAYGQAIGCMPARRISRDDR